MYARPLIEEAKEALRDLFRDNFQLTLADVEIQILANNPELTPRLINEAILQLIQHKDVLYDRFGNSSYLQTNNSVIFLQKDYPTLSLGQNRNYDLSVYSSNLIATEPHTLNDILNELDQPVQNVTLETLFTLNPSDPQFNLTIDKLNLQKRVQLLEETIEIWVLQRQIQLAHQMLMAKPDPNLQRQLESLEIRFNQLTRGNYNEARVSAIYRRFYTVLTATNEPVTMLERLRLSKMTRGPGRHATKKGIVAQMKKKEEEAIEYYIDPNSELVYIHTLYTQWYELVTYNVLAKTKGAAGLIRILKPSEGLGWRDVTDDEYSIYKRIARNHVQEILAPYEDPKIPIYSIYSSVDGTFKIRDKTTQTQSKDNRHINPGLTCTYWHKPDLISLMWRLETLYAGGFGLRWPDTAVVNVTTRDEMIQNLVSHNAGSAKKEEPLDNFSNEKLRFFYNWFNSGVIIENMCNMLNEAFIRKGLMVVL